MDKPKRVDIQKQTAEKIIEMLEQGQIPWQKQWDDGGMGSMPYNYGSGRSYSGQNVLHLMTAQMSNGFRSSGWLTYKMAQELGGNVRKGAKSTTVKFVHDVKDEEGNPVLDKDGRPKINIVHYALFNADQCDGLPIREIQLKDTNWVHSECERLLADSGVSINHDGGGRAFYRPSTDSIHLPEKGQFNSPDAYYATALHELGHASGHASRLNRDLSGKFGSESYAKEELRAEIFSMMVGDRLGVREEQDFGNHVAYLQSWIKIIKEDHKEIFNAVSDAEKICKHYNIESYKREPLEITKKEEPSNEAQVQQAKKSYTPRRRMSKVA